MTQTLGATSSHPSMGRILALSLFSSVSPAEDDSSPLLPEYSPDGASMSSGASLASSRPLTALQLSGWDWDTTRRSIDAGSTSRCSMLCIRYLSLSPVSKRTLLPSDSTRTEKPLAPMRGVFTTEPSS